MLPKFGQKATEMDPWKTSVVLEARNGKAALAVVVSWYEEQMVCPLPYGFEYRLKEILPSGFVHSSLPLKATSSLRTTK